MSRKELEFWPRLRFREVLNSYMVLRSKLTATRSANIVRVRARYRVPRTHLMHLCYGVYNRTNLRSKWWD